MSKEEDKRKIVATSKELIDILEKLRGTIKDATSQEFAENLSYKELSGLLAKKIQDANLKFKFP